MSSKTKKTLPLYSVIANFVLIFILFIFAYTKNNRLDSISQISEVHAQDIAQLSSETDASPLVYGSAIRENIQGKVVLDVSASIGEGDKYAVWFVDGENNYYLGEMKPAIDVYTLNLSNGEKYLDFNELIIAERDDGKNMGKVILKGKFK